MTVLLKVGRIPKINRNILLILSPKEQPVVLCTALKKHGFFTSIATSVYTAFEYLLSHSYAFLLLDFDLNRAFPFLAKTMAAFLDPPPYILAADRYSCSLARTEILDLGVDICIEKPLDAEEVCAVISAVLRRANRLAHPRPLHSAKQIERGTLNIDSMRRSVSIDGQPVTLTAKEFDILHLLSSHPDIVFSKAQIYERVWNEEYLYASPTSVSDLISSIRKKLGLTPKDGRYIQTVFGTGYRFVSPE